MIKEGYRPLNSSEIMDNFRNVLESVYSEYDDTLNESHDFVGICLMKMNESGMEFINESINSQMEIGSLNESMLNEDLEVTNPHIVKEKKGSGISVTINGKEYRYVSPDRSTSDLFRSFMGMMKYAKNGGKALAYLKKNSLCYYGSKNDSEEGKELLGIDE